MLPRSPATQAVGSRSSAGAPSLASVSGSAPSIDDLSGDPHPHLARLRATSPVAWVPALRSFLVTSRSAAIEVLRDPATFTVDDPRFSTAQVVGPSMLSLDGREHARHRTPFVAPFRPRQVTERFGRSVDAVVDRLVGDIVDVGPDLEIDLLPALAGPLSAAVVADSLGLDGADPLVVGRLLGWYREIVGSVTGVASGEPVTAGGAEAMADLGATLRDHLDAGDSLLADASGHGGLSADEVVSNAAVVMFGGIETTEGMLLNAVWHLLSWPEQLAEVVADPALVAVAVEESLRMEPAAAVVDRYATRDLELGGAAIPAGAPVTVSLAGANRDPAEFADPDRFDVRRPNARRHLAFASGPHVCVGMDLARLEVVTAVRALLALPDLRLSTDAPAPTGLVFRKPARLPVRWG